MTYVLVTDDNKVDVREGEPTVEDVIELTGKGVPELARTGNPDVVFWVNDNWISRLSVGDFKRNVLPSLFYLLLDPLPGKPPAFGGPVVITGLREQDGQLLPAGLSEEKIDSGQGAEGSLAEAVRVILGDFSAIATAEALPVPELEMPVSLQETTRASMDQVLALPVESLDGGWHDPSFAEFLVMQGMPRGLAEMIAGAQDQMEDGPIFPGEDPREGR